MKEEVFSITRCVRRLISFTVSVVLLTSLVATNQEAGACRSSTSWKAKKQTRSTAGTQEMKCHRQDALKVSQSDLKKHAITKVAPIPSYGHGRGRVTVELTIDESGKGECVSAVSGPIILRGSAITAAEQWTFKPWRVKGKSVQVRARLTFNFQGDQVFF